jgi:hypothetical protein
MVGDGPASAGVGLGSGELVTGAVVGIVCAGAGVKVAGSETVTDVGVARGVGVAEHAARKRSPIITIGAPKVAVSGVIGVCLIFRAPAPNPHRRVLMKARDDSVGP